MAADERSVQAHYSGAGLLDRILAGLRAAGKDPDAPTIEDLAPADEFHSLGRVATKDLAEPPLGMHIVLGERHAEKRTNSGRALRDGRIRYVQGVFVKPA